jgi:Ni,Fe-hydrogenase III component G
MLTIDNLNEKLKELFSGTIIKTEKQLGNRLFIDIPRQNIREFSRKIIELGGRYQVSIGYDQSDQNQTLGLIHAFVFDRENLFLKVRTSAPVDDPVVDSITPDIPSAGWSER